MNDEISKEIFYKQSERLEHAEKFIKESEIPEDNKNLILEFNDFRATQGISKLKIVNDVYTVNKIFKQLDKTYTNITNKDVTEILNSIDDENISQSTKDRKKIILKVFLLWLKKYKSVKIRINFKIKQLQYSRVKSKDELLTVEEQKKLIAAASKPRDRAFISVLLESGARMGELGRIQIKDIIKDSLGFIINIPNNKVKARTNYQSHRSVRIIVSASYLSDWLNKHPNNVPESYVWVKKNGDLLSVTGIHSILKSAIKYSNIKKRIYYHLLRHTRYNEISKKLKPYFLNRVMGWSDNTRMHSIYSHWDFEDIDDELLKNVYGIKGINENNNGHILERKKCVCGQENAPTNTYCDKCLLPLDNEKLYEIIKQDIKFREFLSDVEKKLPSGILSKEKETIESAKKTPRILICYNCKSQLQDENVNFCSTCGVKIKGTKLD